MKATALRDLVLTVSILSFGVGCASDAEPSAGATADDYTATRSGSFTFLTYNVHGMPNLVTSRDPKADIPQISARLNPYDAVVVQKDFVYHDELVADLTLPHRTAAPEGKGTWYNLGDGLNAFSRFPITDVVRHAWGKCHGYLGSRSDCFAPKGFMKVTIEVAAGVFVDVYDVHMDAGRSTKDIQARDSQVAELEAGIAELSAGHAVIVGGDTSLRESDAPTLQTLLTGSDLADACLTVSCPEPGRQNRVMFRSSAALKLTVEAWKVETTFVNDQGEQLSDQEPVKVTFGWRAE